MKRMMLVLMLFATNTYAGEWESLIKNEKGDIYFSPSSLSKDALDRTLVWVKFVDKTKETGFSNIKMLKVVDCDKRQVGTGAFKGYKGSKLVKDMELPPLMAQMNTPDPDGFDAVLVKSLCEI